MAKRASYSIFPPSEDVLQRQQSKRMPRARIPSSSSSTKRAISAHSSLEDTSSLFEEQRSSFEAQAIPASKSTDNLVPQRKEEREEEVQTSAKPALQQTTHRTRLCPQLPTIYSPPPESVHHPPALPPPTKPLPSAPKPTPTVDTNCKDRLKPAVTANGTRHKRNLTGSTTTSVTKPSPITPDSQTSANSLFSPITPPSAAPSTGPPAVKYPNVPRLSSSPAPSVFEQWSPPRRSQSRSTNRSQTTTADLISSYAHTRDGSNGRTVAPGVRRNASSATSRTGTTSRTHQTQQPSVSNSISNQAQNTVQNDTGMRTMFPVHNPDALPMQQNHKVAQAPQFHLPAQRLEAKPYSARSNTSSLTKEALEAHNGSNSGKSMREAPSKPDGPSSQSKTEVSTFPPRSQSLPRNKARSQNTSPITQQQAPEFPPPPRRELSTRSKSRAVLTKPKPPPKDESSEARPDKPSSELARKGNPILEQRQKKMDFQVAGKGSYTANTSATTKYDKEQNAVTTTATTTIVNVPVKNGPLHASSDYAAIIDGKEFSKEEVDVHHQHSVAVALGAMAFAMGVGVELVGGAVNGLKGNKTKVKKEKKAIEAA